MDSDLLIGADGIHSKVRDQILKSQESPKLSPYYCGYTYYRATLKIHEDEYHKFSSSFESWGDGGKRFGYVPLKKPEVKIKHCHNNPLFLF